MSDENEGPGDPRDMQKGMEVVSEIVRTHRPVRRVAESVARTVVKTCSGDGRNRLLYLLPDQDVLAHAVIEHDGRRALPDAHNVHSSVAADIDEILVQQFRT